MINIPVKSNSFMPVVKKEQIFLVVGNVNINYLKTHHD
jgi:hypothetical protein